MENHNEHIAHDIDKVIDEMENLNGSLDGLDKDDVNSKAKEIVDEMKDDNFMEGMDEMQKLSFLIGSQVPKILFNYVVDYVDASNDLKRIWRSKISDATLDEVGSMKIDFIDKNTKKSSTAYLVFDECDKDHNINEELNKLAKRLINPAKISEMSDHIFAMSMLGVRAFSNVGFKLDEMLKDIEKRVNIKDFKINNLVVNDTKVIFSTSIPNSKCVGIYVRFEEELPKQ